MPNVTKPPMSPATKTIHLAEGVSDSAEPLTTPIYETTTFVFESADPHDNTAPATIT